MTVAVQNTLPDPVADVVQHLFQNPLGGFTADERLPYKVRRVGRNEVWEATTLSQPEVRYYIKRCPSLDMFRRELEGYRIIEKVAAQCGWVMNARVLLTDETTGVILLNELCGTSGERLVSRALRRFPPIPNSTVAIQEALDCVSKILQFLNQLHHVLCSDSHLAAHHPSALVARINRLAGNLREHPATAKSTLLDAFPVRLQDFPIDELPRNCLLHGDPTPGNFILCQGRLGVLDFEDMGFGPAGRDSLWLDYHLEQYGLRWRYRGASRLRELISLKEFDLGMWLLLRTEFHLIHLTAISRRPGQSMLSRHRDRLERNQVMRSLRQCCDFLFEGRPLSPCQLPA